MISGLKRPPAGFQIGRERNMGRNDKIDLQIRGLCLFQDGLDALQTGHDANLVQIRHDARRAVSPERPPQTDGSPETSFPDGCAHRGSRASDNCPGSR